MVPTGAWMRILFDHQTFSYQKFGGNSRYFAELMNEFHAAGEPQFELSVARSPNAYLRDAPYYRGRTSERTDTLSFLATYSWNALHTWRATRHRHDIVHATFYDPDVLRMARGARLVITVLDMIPERFPEYFTVTGLYGRLVTRRWIEGKRTLCERADAILAISEHTKKDLVASYGIDPARITVTHLGNRLAANRNARRPAGLAARYVLYVGTRNTYKNFPLFLEALAPLLAEDATLSIECIGGGAFDEAEQELITRLGITGHVAQRAVSDEELAACYQHAIAFVFPSRYEGFGIPILEAFACDCPVLVAKASCFPEIAGDAALYFDPDDPQSLRVALGDLLGDAQLASSLRKKGRARARQFTWDNTARQTVAAYRKVLAA